MARQKLAEITERAQAEECENKDVAKKVSWDEGNTFESVFSAWGAAIQELTQADLIDLCLSIRDRSVATARQAFCSMCSDTPRTRA